MVTNRGDNTRRGDLVGAVWREKFHYADTSEVGAGDLVYLFAVVDYLRDYRFC